MLKTSIFFICIAALSSFSVRATQDNPHAAQQNQQQLPHNQHSTNNQPPLQRQESFIDNLPPFSKAASAAGGAILFAACAYGMYKGSVYVWNKIRSAFGQQHDDE